jgi:RNA polymerase sigma-70 factor (ECF subfamily)
MVESDAKDPMSDTVRRAQDGDQAAFRALYEAHAGRVYALCLRLAASAAEANELTQDVFVRAWQRLETFRGESAFGTWLHRLAVNEVLQARRAAARRTARVALPGDDGLLARSATVRPEPEWDLEQAIAGLPEGAREVFVLYDVEGYSHEEIAHLTGVAVGTSKAQLHRARRLLRERIDR